MAAAPSPRRSADLEERVPRPLVLIVGMLATKDSAGFLRNFSGWRDALIAVPIHQDKTLPAEALAQTRARRRHSGRSRGQCRGRARAVARLELAPAPRILITGSLYLAGEVLAANGTPPR